MKYDAVWVCVWDSLDEIWCCVSVCKTVLGVTDVLCFYFTAVVQNQRKPAGVTEAEETEAERDGNNVSSSELWGEFKIQDYFIISSEELKRGWTLTTELAYGQQSVLSAVCCDWLGRVAPTYHVSAEYCVLSVICYGCWVPLWGPIPPCDNPFITCRSLQCLPEWNVAQWHHNTTRGLLVRMLWFTDS